MGLFNRSSKSDVPLNGDEWSTNGASPRREATPEPTEAERAPAPTPEPEAPVEEISERDDAPTLGAEDLQSDPEPEPDQQPEPDPEPEPVAATTPAPVEAKPMPPVNRSEPEDGDDQRMSAEQALAPVRRPGMSRPPGAHIGDESERRAKIISFANQKGGVAKTTTTLNLAVAFKESGHDVLAIDLDPQGNLTMSQGIDPDQVDKSMYDVLVHDMPIREVIQEREIDIGVASIDLAGAEIAMSTKIGRERSLEKALAEVQADYDFVCIDTPPSLGLLTVNALTAADKVIVPVQCEYLS